jgi:DNA adenine methylase
MTEFRGLYGRLRRSGYVAVTHALTPLEQMKRIDPIGTSRKIAAIPYYGGKFRLARHIVPIIESIDHKVYCEPCIGGASVFLWRSPDSSKVEVINDINSDIVSIYRAFKLYPKSVLKSIDSIPYSVELYREAVEIRKRERLLELSKKDLILIATCSYFNILTTFGNMPNVTSMNYDKSCMVKFCRQWGNKKTLLRTIIGRFENVYIDNYDLIDCINKWDSKDTLFYIDPPYYNTRNDGYINGSFTEDNYKTLCDLLDTIAGNFILSGYKNDIYPDSINSLYSKKSRNTINDVSKKHVTEMIYVKGSNLEIATLTKII